jgi:hypothetical protein
MTECIIQKLSEFDPEVARFIKSRTCEDMPEATETIKCPGCELMFTKVQTWNRERRVTRGHFTEMRLTLAFVITGPRSFADCLRNK